MIIWFASVVNWAWKQYFDWRRVRGDGLLFAPILAVVLLGGSARLALFSLQAITVRVADIYASQAVVAAFNPQLPPATMFLLVSGKATQADHAFTES